MSTDDPSRTLPRIHVLPVRPDIGLSTAVVGAGVRGCPVSLRLRTDAAGCNADVLRHPVLYTKDLLQLLRQMCVVYLTSPARTP